MDTIWGKVPERVRELEAKEMNWTPVIIIFAVLAAIVILAVLFGSKSKKRKQAVIEDEREDCYDDDVTLEKVLKKHSVRPEIVIRYYYRKFMKKSEAKKHKLEASDTTKEILAKYKAWNNATTEQTTKAEEATALYQKTRYSKAKMTQTDANRMKAFVKGI